MMYQNLIYFLVVLLVYTAYEPSGASPGVWTSNMGLIFLIYVVYGLIAVRAFKRLRIRIETGSKGVGPGLGYHRLQNRLSILALALYIIDVYFLGLKDILSGWPGFSSVSALNGLFGLAFFALFLFLMWLAAFDVYALIYRSHLTRFRFAFSQLRFNLPIVIPFLIISLAEDLFTWIPDGEITRWFDTLTGELVSTAVFLALLAALFPILIRPLWGLKPLPPGPHREAIERFCHRTGFHYRDVMLWPLYEGEGLTAGVMGLVRRWRFILVTEALLRILDPEELEAVLAHELGHVKKHHIAIYLLFFLGFMVLGYALFDLNIFFLLALERLGGSFLLTGPQAGTALTLIMSLPMALGLILYFRFVFGAFMRNFERQADLFSYRLTGTVKGLVGSLEKIAFYSGQSRSVPSWHHFSVAERVDFLLACLKNPRLVFRHERKVRRMLAGYVAAVVIVTASGFAFQHSGVFESADRGLQVSILESVIRQKPDDAEAMRLLGNMYYSAGKFQLAVEAYERAAALTPDDPEVLNSLAWTLITQKKPTAADRERGLELARKAVELSPKAYILDTLAEAFFVNGRLQEALETSESALGRPDAGLDRDHLQKQRDKFRRALQNDQRVL